MSSINSTSSYGEIGALAPRLSEIFSSRDALLRERYAALIADDAEARPAVPRTRSLTADGRRKLRAYVEEHGQGDIVGLAANAAYQPDQRAFRHRAPEPPHRVRQHPRRRHLGGRYRPRLRGLARRRRTRGDDRPRPRQPAPSSRGSATPSPSSSTCFLERHGTLLGVVSHQPSLPALDVHDARRSRRPLASSPCGVMAAHRRAAQHRCRTTGCAHQRGCRPLFGDRQRGLVRSPVRLPRKPAATSRSSTCTSSTWPGGQNGSRLVTSTCPRPAGGKNACTDARSTAMSNTSSQPGRKCREHRMHRRHRVPGIQQIPGPKLSGRLRRTRPLAPPGPRWRTARPPRPQPGDGGRTPTPRWSCPHRPARTTPRSAAPGHHRRPAGRPGRSAAPPGRPGTPGAAPTGPGGWPPRAAADTPPAPRRPRRGRRPPTRSQGPIRSGCRPAPARPGWVGFTADTSPWIRPRGHPAPRGGNIHIATGRHPMISRRHHPGRRLAPGSPAPAHEDHLHARVVLQQVRQPGHPLRLHRCPGPILQIRARGLGELVACLLPPAFPAFTRSGLRPAPQQPRKPLPGCLPRVGSSSGHRRIAGQCRQRHQRLRQHYSPPLPPGS